MGKIKKGYQIEVKEGIITSLSEFKNYIDLIYRDFLREFKEKKTYGKSKIGYNLQVYEILKGDK